MKNILILSFLSLSLFLTGCAAGVEKLKTLKKPKQNPPVAPIVDGWQQRQEASLYRVQPDDTIYSIAWAFGVDYQNIARYNHLSEPYTLRPGQTLSLSGQSGQSSGNNQSSGTATVVTYAAPSASSYTYVPAQNTAPTFTAAKSGTPSNAASNNGFRSVPSAAVAGQEQKVQVAAESAPTSKPVAKGTWAWPTKGKLAKGYSASSGGNHGVDISGRIDQPVVASASGKVVYTGSNMPGYGKLIIIKHNNNDLSAYAFNNTILVKEGEAVKEGQSIATMGKNTDGQAMLHFEVRKNGKPQDPMNYLGAS